jgi:hypothetical protein
MEEHDIYWVCPVCGAVVDKRQEDILTITGQDISKTFVCEIF